VKNSRGNFLEKMWKKIGVEETWINDLEEVKSVEKCQCGKKRDKFPWKNITYLVVILARFGRASPPKLMPYATLYQCFSHLSSSVNYSPILTSKYETVNKNRSSMSLSKHFNVK